MRALTQRQLWIRLAVALLLPLTIGGLFLGSRASGPASSRAAVVDLDTPAEVNGAPVALGRELAAALVNTPATDDLTWVELSASDAAQQLESGDLAAVVTVPKGFSTDATAAARGEEPRQATIVIDTSPVTTLSETVLTRAVASAATRAVGSTVTANYLQNAFVTWRQAGTALANTSAEASTVAGQAADLSKQASGNAQDAQTVAAQVAGASQSLAAAADPAVTGDPVAKMSELQGAAGSAKQAGAAAADAGKGAAAGADQAAAASDDVSSATDAANTNAAATQAAIAALKLQAADLNKQAADQAGTAAGYQAQVQAAAASQKALQTQVLAVQDSVDAYVNKVAALANPKVPQAAPVGGPANANTGTGTVPNPLAPQLREQAKQLRALADSLDAQDVSAARDTAQIVADSTRDAYTSAIRLGHDLAQIRGDYINRREKDCPYDTVSECRIWRDGVIHGLGLAQGAMDTNDIIKKTRRSDEDAHALLRQLTTMAATASDLSAQARASADALEKLANTPVAGGDTGALMNAIQEVASQGGAVSGQAGAAADSGADQVKAMSALESAAGETAAGAGAISSAAQSQAKAVDQVNDSMGTLNTTLSGLQNQADALVDTAKTNTEQSQALASQLDKMAAQAAALANQTDSAASTVSQTNQGQQAAAAQVKAAAAGAGQVAAGAQLVSEGAGQVSTGTTKVATTAKEGVEAVPDTNGGSQRVIDVLSEPVVSQVNSPATVTWITAVVILAIWVGAMALAWGIPITGGGGSGPETSEPTTVLREIGPRVGVAVVQAMLLALAAYPSLSAIGPQTDQMMATIAISAVVFSLVNMALAVWLRGWGMLISTILALITLAAAASPVTNLGMTVLKQLSPASVGLDAIRTAAVTGSASAGQTVALLVWAALGVVFATLGILRLRGTEQTAPAEARLA